MILPSALEEDGTKCISTGINKTVEQKLPFGSHSFSHDELIPILILTDLAPQIHFDKGFPDIAAESDTFFIFDI